MAASVLEVLITGDATSYRVAIGQANAATQEFKAATQASTAATKEASASTTAFGQSASRAMNYAKLGALAFAAVSVKAALDFNREFTLIAAVTNTAADKLEGLKSTVMDLSHQTGIAPQEIAHSLYFLASAGLDSTQQMQALEASAKGAAIGLGEAGDLARIEANALNAFADQGLTATQVMDTLTAAIRTGTAEPDEFAQALGRVLPIADNAGISFMQVAASLATMSNAGLDVNEGVTALRAMLQSLVAPTAQTTSAFQQMGLTVTDVVASMKGQGLIATLRLISDRARAATDSTGEYNQMMRHAIPNIRGLAGALNLTQQEAAKVDAIFQQVSNSTGDMEQAFRTTAESDAFKVTQAINDIKIAGMNLASDVLPLVADALQVVAKNADLVVKGLIAWAAVRWIVPFIKSLTAANYQLAASEVAAGAAAQASAAKQVTAAKISTAGMARFPVMGPASTVADRPGFVTGLQTQAATQLAKSEATLAAESAAAAGGFTGLIAKMKLFVTQGGTASNAVTGLASEMGGLSAAVSKGLDFAGPIAAIYGITDALQRFGAQVVAVKNTDFNSFASNFISSLTSPIANFATGGGGLMHGLTHALMPFNNDDIQHFTDGIASVQQTLQLAGKDTEEQTTIINNAIHSIGGTLDPSNIDDFVTAIQGQLDAEAQQKAAAEQQAAAALELTKQTQAADEATQSWQQTTARMTSHLTGLSRIGIDVNAFMDKLQSDLADSDDQAKTFADAIDEVSTAWSDFKAKAQQALFFIPGALNDVTSAAQQAQDQLDSMTTDTSLTNREVAALRDTANLTGDDILHAFQEANHESREFYTNLKDIATTGGAAGKDLASSLLESGNVMAAQVIAGAENEKQIIRTFGTGERMADKFSTKLTNAIVGPLDDIKSILAKIARQQFGIKLHLDDGGAKKKTHDLKTQVDDLTRQRHRLLIEATDSGAKEYLVQRQQQVNELTGHKHSVNVFANTEAAKNALATFEQNLTTLTTRKYTVDVGVHTHGKSPMPDEALKKHLFDPMRQAGFKRVGDSYTLPLDVGVHTALGDPTTGGKKATAGLAALKDIERRQLNVLLDIRKELKGIHAGKKSGGGGDFGSGSDGSGGSGHHGDGRPHGALDEMRVATPIRRAVDDIFSKIYKSGMTPGEAKGIIRRVAEEGRNPKFVGGLIKDVAHELGPHAAKEFGKSLHALDRRTANNAKHQQDALDAARRAFEEMSKETKAAMKKKAANEEARKEWMADALAYATHNVPRLPRGHTHIDPNEHERDKHKHRRPVSLNMDRRKFTDAASYDVDYARGF